MYLVRMHADFWFQFYSLVYQFCLIVSWGFLPLQRYLSLSSSDHGLDFGDALKWERYTVLFPAARVCTGKCMCRYVGHVVSAIIEKSDLDQVLSRRRPINSWRWGPPFSVLFARCASLCSSIPTLQGSASTVLASSPCGGCSSRFCGQNIKLSLRTYRYQ